MVTARWKRIFLFGVDMKIRVSLGMCLSAGALLLYGVVAVCGGGMSLADVRSCVWELWPVAVAVLLHEGGHILAARLCGVRLGEMRIDLFGARLGLCGLMSYRQERLIAAAGPAVNLLSAAAVLISAGRAGESGLSDILLCEGSASVFAASSLGLAAINLLPVRSLDGGRILRCTAAPLFGERIADAAVTAGTALCLGALWLFSVYALLRVGEMLSLFTFSICLLGRMMGGR